MGACMACKACKANINGSGFDPYDSSHFYELCWPNGEIFFKIEYFTSQNLLEKVYKAINHWNRVHFPHCVFKLASNQSYWVTFIENKSGGYPEADIGCLLVQDQVISLPELYPDGSEVMEECILHEMMHCAGFVHEHQRNDRNEHLIVEDEGANYDISGIPIGVYDYFSLMHYPECGLSFDKNKELRKLGGRAKTFSAGDRAAIKMLYGNPRDHHGEWHNPCSENCTPIKCVCNSCNKIEGSTNCGYEGMNGHWTCCLSEIKESQCNSDHTGFWHAPCKRLSPFEKFIYRLLAKDKICTESHCGCGNCGGGCTYEGEQGHWNCCNFTRYDSSCPILSKIELAHQYDLKWMKEKQALTGQYN